MATARKKKASKKTGKKSGKKRRTKAQIAATKRLVRANKARAKGKKISARKRPRAKTGKKQSIRRRSKAYWTKWAKAQPVKTDVHGRAMFSGPMTRQQDRAMRSAMRAMGMAYDEPTAETYRTGSGELVLQSPKVLTRKKPAKKRAPKAKRPAKRGHVSAEAIIKNAQKAAKLSKIGQLLKSRKMPKSSAVWMCGNPYGKRTGCGGGMKRRLGSRVIGIVQ